MENRTKIIATIGPACENKAIMKKMISNGMDAVRLNFSHGTYSEFAQIIKNVRELGKETNREIAVIQDLSGPKIRVGEVPKEGVALKEGQKVTLSIKNEPDTIPIQYRDLPKDVKHGDFILIDDGLIELKVESVNKTKTRIDCKVIVPGTVFTHKGINVPTASISTDPFTKKDRKDAEFGIKHHVDYIALSFVKTAENILALKQMLKQKKSFIKVIAKIERHEAITNMEEIINASDAVMVARGDLGVEMPAEQVPLYQKKIIHLCNLYGKPVIVATQILNSMVTEPRATRAEISDAATAIFDHADAFMLTNETAVGKYPVESVHTLSKVAGAVENELKNHQHLLQFKKEDDIAITNATCHNASKLANDIKARFIVAISKSGFTVREIARYRPFIPTIVFTPNLNVARQMSIVWGVRHTFVQFIHLNNPLPQIRKSLIQNGLVKEGDEIVVCNAGFGRKEKLITTTII